ncbi:hypothetical protein RUM43_007308 [Polyplax serrata]|uniref:Uncharacterized protein n=1 Tax=Polyplax serrata TaxID=468196 RepID=A0AAN8PM27_POLSC
MIAADAHSTSPGKLRFGFFLYEHFTIRWYLKYKFEANCFTGTNEISPKASGFFALSDKYSSSIFRMNNFAAEIHPGGAGLLAALDGQGNSAE